jgi:hypothetical protein
MLKYTKFELFRIRLYYNLGMVWRAQRLILRCIEKRFPFVYGKIDQDMLDKPIDKV